MSWVVADVDEGVLRREKTRTLAVEWLKGYSGAKKVVSRHLYAPGHYEYRVGESADDAVQADVVREDMLAQAGYDPGQAPLFPLRSAPHDEMPRL